MNKCTEWKASRQIKMLQQMAYCAVNLFKLSTSCITHTFNM